MFPSGHDQCKELDVSVVSLRRDRTKRGVSVKHRSRASIDWGVCIQIHVFVCGPDCVSIYYQDELVHML